MDDRMKPTRQDLEYLKDCFYYKLNWLRKNEYYTTAKKYEDSKETLIRYVEEGLKNG